MEENGGNITEEEFPFGDWLRSSPMKAVNVMNSNGSGTRENLRRYLFTKGEQIKEKSEEVPNEEENIVHDPHTLNQLDALMDSLGKVGVSMKENETQVKINPNLLKAQVEPHSHEENHGAAQSCRRNPSGFTNTILHPTTKTTTPISIQASKHDALADTKTNNDLPSIQKPIMTFLQSKNLTNHNH